MSLYEKTQLGFDLDLVLQNLGWKKYIRKVYHERDWGGSWDEEVWLDCNERPLITLDKINVHFAHELRRLSELICH